MEGTAGFPREIASGCVRFHNTTGLSRKLDHASLLPNNPSMDEPRKFNLFIFLLLILIVILILLFPKFTLLPPVNFHTKQMLRKSAWFRKMSLAINCKIYLMGSFSCSGLRVLFCFIFLREIYVFERVTEREREGKREKDEDLLSADSILK